MNVLKKFLSTDRTASMSLSHLGATEAEAESVVRLCSSRLSGVWAACSPPNVTAAVATPGSAAEARALGTKLL